MAKSGEVLSQEQIDQMIGAMQQGDMLPLIADQSQVRSYDFRNPSQFSREHMQTMQAVHEVFARLLSTQLSTQMRLPVQVELSTVDQLTYDDFMASVSHPTVVLIYRMEPLEGNILFEMPPGTAISMIERLMGGSGRVPPRPRELTDIEQTLISNVFNKSMHALRESWRNLLPDLKPLLQTLETNPRFVQVSGSGDSILALAFDLRLGESQHALRMCLPYPTVERLLPQLKRQYFMAQHQPDQDDQESQTEVRRQLQEVELRLALLLGYTEISLGDLINLEQGDVVSLNSLIDDALVLTVEQRAKFLARPGRVGRKLAAQITQIQEDGTL